jgi:hypothetical protein
MNNNWNSIFLILLLTFSLLPTSVSADDSGRYAHYISVAPYEVGTGGIIEIEAMVTGTQYYDSEEITRYNIWAESDAGEIYSIAQGLDGSEGVITYSWLIPESIPTGNYSICVEEGINFDEYNNINPQYKTCSAYVNIVRYHIDLEVNNEILLPDDTVRVWATVSSPIDGSPETPQTAGWKITYETGEASWNSETQEKSGILTPDSENQFEVLLPSNLLPDSMLQITFYANDSSGTQQLSEVMKSVPIGHLTASISMPSNEQVIPLNSDFVLQVDCMRTSTNWGWGWMPEVNLPLTVKLEQGENKKLVSISSNLQGQPSEIRCDSNGHVSLLLTADDVELEAGPAELVVYWADPSSSEEEETSQTVYLSADGSEPLNGVGIEVFINGPLTSSKPGEEITLTVNTIDLAGNPLPGIWVHHLTSRYSDGGIADRSKWNIQQSDSQGKLNILMTIPEDLKTSTGSLRLVVKVKNETGITDEAEHHITLIEPDINLYPSTMTWLPGDVIKMRIDAKDMTGNVVLFWNVADLDLDGELTFAANSQGSFSFTAPERETQDISSITISVIAIDSSGETSYDNYRLYKSHGYSMMVTPPSEVIIAGETISIPYVLSAMDPTVPVEYPISWTATIMGVADSQMTGYVDSASGSIEYTVPSYLISGTYLIGFTFEQQATYIPIEIRSDDDAAGVSGTFSSVTDSLDSASGWVSTLALVLAFACLALLLKRGKKKEEEEWSSFNEPLPLATPKPPPPLPLQEIPEYDPTSPTGYAQPPRY